MQETNRKYIILLILCYLYCSTLFAQTKDTTQGIFKKASYVQPYLDTVKNLSNIEHLCVYFYFNNCGACVKMENSVLPDTNVVNFYSNNFVTVKINTTTKYGEKLKNKYDITGHPHFIFFDQSGNILHRLVGLATPRQFIHHGKRALTSKGLAYYNQQYKNGNHSPEFLRNYCYLLDSANREDSIIVNDYLNTQSYTDLGTEKNIRFIYLYCLLPPGKHGPIPTIGFHSETYQFLREEKEKFYDYFPKEQVLARIITIAKYHAKQAIQDTDRQHFEEALNVIRSYKDMGEIYYYHRPSDPGPAGVFNPQYNLLGLQESFYKQLGQPDKAQEYEDKYIELIWDDWRALNRTAWYTYQNSNDAQQLEKALQWVERSVKINSTHYNQDTRARILYKLGRHKKALKIARKAVTLAKEAEQEHTEITEFIKQIKNKEK